MTHLKLNAAEMMIEFNEIVFFFLEIFVLDIFIKIVKTFHNHYSSAGV